MTFLTPFLLAALGALAVPVIIHLIQRERKNLVNFPSLMFLRRIPYPSVRRRRIRNWILLTIRMLALLLIVLAFARPFLDRPELAASASSGPRELVILLDRSYSMGYETRWAEAQAAARRVTESLGPGDRGTLVVFDAGAEATIRSTPDRARLAAAIDETSVGASATRFGPALKLALATLAGSQLPRREIVLISDFQRAGWEQTDAVSLPAGYVLTPVRIGDDRTSNVAVTGVQLQRGTFSGQDRVTLSAAIENLGPAPVDVDVTLELDGRAVQNQRVQVDSRSATSTMFAPVTLEAETRGVIRLEPDLLPRDDAFYFVVAPGRPVPVLVLHRAAASDASFFLRRALAIGNAPAFGIEVKPIEQAEAADLRPATSDADNTADTGPAVVILDDAMIPPGDFTDALHEFVASGGGVLVALGERSAWSDRAATWLPGLPRAVVDRASGRGAVLDVVDDTHPVFELFKGPLAGGFSSARFFGYRTLELPAPSTGAERDGTDAEAPAVLARFDDRAVALVERRVGRGTAMVWTSTLDTFWNDLALKPVFLPFVHRIVVYLSRYRAPSAWLNVGQIADMEAARRDWGVGGDAATDSAEIDTVLTPSGSRLSSSSPLVALKQEGFYEARFRGQDRPVVFASNVETTESDLSSIDPSELVASVSMPEPGADPADAVLAGADAAIEVPAEIQERQQAIWWYLMLAGVILLVTDTVLSNRLSRASG